MRLSNSVSIVIPAYNRAHCLDRAIQSALGQKQDVCTVCEVIVVDDSSSDHTVEVVDNLRRNSPTIRILRHPQNKGVSAARNTGIEAAKGTYIAFLDSDDIWVPHKLDAQISAMKELSFPPEKTFSLSYFEGIKPNGEYVTKELMLENLEWGDKTGRFKNFRIYTEEDLKRIIVIDRYELGGYGSTLLAHRDALRKNGPFREDLGYGEDAEYVIRHILHNGRISVAAEPLMTYYLPAENKPYPNKAGYSRAMLHFLNKVEECFGATAAQQFANKHSNSLRRHMKTSGATLITAFPPPQ